MKTVFLLKAAFALASPETKTQKQSSWFEFEQWTLLFLSFQCCLHCTKCPRKMGFTLSRFLASCDTSKFV